MSALSGKRILVVEDESIVAAMVEDMLAELGATVVGPASTVARGVALAEAAPVDAAVLDVNVRDERIDPVVDALTARKIPFVFATGYGAFASSAPDAPILAKPYTQQKLAQALGRVIAS